MTVQTPPVWMTASSHDAQHLRALNTLAFGSPVGSFTTGVIATTAGGGHGIMMPTDFAVTQHGPDMSVDVSAGAACVRGSENPLQGVYGVINDATVNLPIAASDPSNPRRDLICLQVRDSGYGFDVTNDARLVVVTGTPAVSPVDPSLTSYKNILVLARIAVGAGVTSIVNANITDLRTRASSLGGVLPCTSTTRPTAASLYAGLVIYETDTKIFQAYDGSAWIPKVSIGAWQTYTPVITGSVTNPTIGAGAAPVGRYTVIGKTCMVRAYVDLGGAGFAAGSGNYSISVPIAAAAVAPRMVGFIHVFNTGSTISGPLYAYMVGGASVVTGSYPAAWPFGAATIWGAGAPMTLAINGNIDLFAVYETA